MLGCLQGGTRANRFSQVWIFTNGSVYCWELGWGLKCNKLLVPGRKEFRGHLYAYASNKTKLAHCWIDLRNYPFSKSENGSSEQLGTLF